MRFYIGYRGLRTLSSVITVLFLIGVIFSIPHCLGLGRPAKGSAKELIEEANQKQDEYSASAENYQNRPGDIALEIKLEEKYQHACRAKHRHDKCPTHTYCPPGYDPSSDGNPEMASCLTAAGLRAKAESSPEGSKAREYWDQNKKLWNH